MGLVAAVGARQYLALRTPPTLQRLTESPTGGTMPLIEVNDAALAERVRATVRRLDALEAVEVALGGAEHPPIRVDGAALTHDGGEVPDWLVEAAVLRALRPSHVLFLCVANSARSQLGEGIGRSLAPAGVRVSSAGSEPTRVRPQAVAVLEEIGIDITDHESKGLDDVPRPVDAVITLCAEEACPAWLEKAWRLHWPLPDPAGAGSDEAEEMGAFRAARDELRRRLGVLFGT
jgi:arsenate reductase